MQLVATAVSGQSGDTFRMARHLNCTCLNTLLSARSAAVGFNQCSESPAVILLSEVTLLFLYNLLFLISCVHPNSLYSQLVKSFAILAVKSLFYGLLPVPEMAACNNSCLLVIGLECCMPTTPRFLITD